MNVAGFLTALTAVAPWVPVGITDTRLRVFFERASIRDVDQRRLARIRIGSPRTIAGPIVLVYQDEEIDCAAKTWRLLSFDARDAENRIVKRSVPGAHAGAVLPGLAGTVGGEVVAAVCAFSLAPDGAKDTM